ncbi:sorting nexin-19-like isoform X1 [Centruroides vittatus]|uniref:sorting nexin-19-like isoform X1 n=2 Tax=Centruroides vittatus TaxID=120091 RepID=UPI00350FEB56
MIRQVISVCLIIAALMLADRYFVFIVVSTICGLFSYEFTYRFIKFWLRNYSIKCRRKRENGLKSRVNEIQSNASTSLQTPIITVENVNSHERTLNCNKFCGLNFSVKEELKTFVRHISRHYIQCWYHKTCQNEDVLQEFNDVLEDILDTANNNVIRMNIIDLSEKVICLYGRHFDNYLRALETVKSDLGCESPVDCVGMENEIKNAYKMTHPALTDQVTEWCYLKSIVASIIDLLWPQEFLGCQVAYNMLEEILTKNVLYPLVDMFSNPEWLNEMIILLLSDDDFVKRKHFSNRKTHKTDDAEISETAPSETRQFHRKCSEIPKGISHVSFDNAIRSLSVRRHSDSNIGHLEICQNTFNFPLSDNYLTVSTDPYASHESSNYSQGNKNLTININSHNKSMQESDWEVWSGEFNEYGDVVKIYPHDLFRIKSQSSQNIENFHFTESSRKNKDLESPDISLKRSKSVDCLSHLTPPLSHVVSLSGSSSNLDAVRTNLSKLVLMNMPDLHRKESNSTDVEEAEEATETAWSDLFSDIQILQTEKQEEPGRGPYILYCIQYNALFVHNNEENNKSQFMKHKMTVKRRFREFLALQGRLEENSKLKKYMKKIKGPNKWLGSLLFPMDKKTVEERRQFLEKYLQELCSCKAIAASSELQEFLAYGGDASIAYVRRIAENIGVPRIDKMLYKGVMGAIDLIKTALPATGPQDEINEKPFSIQNLKSVPHKPSLFLPVFGKSKADSSQQHMEVKYVDNQEHNLIQEIAQYIEKFDINSSEGSLDNESIISDRNLNDLERSESINSMDIPNFAQMGKACTKLKISEFHNYNEECAQQKLKSEIPLANAVIDLYINSLKSFFPLFGNPLIIVGLKIAIGNFLDKYLEENIYSLFSFENCINYLHLLHLVLWPEEESLHPDEQSQQSDDRSCKTDALNALRSFLPDILKIFNNKLFEKSSLLLHDSLQYSQLNRCLIYHILDHLMDHFCARDDIHLQ